ncbi:SET domain-containing protein [Nocardioides sp.]|uniref:SET domain-containing protein n=1 Tax=Nocardioides sp. TaxID=35761 RepID=UPI002F3E5E12
MREPEPECWLHPGVEVRASDVAGRGLFARADLPALTPVSRLGGRLVDTATVRDLIATSADSVETVVVDEDTHLLVAAGDNRFGNHACDPNLGWVGEYTLATMTDVAAGAELLTDYAMSTVDPDWIMGCHCASYRCRQMIEGTDWRIPQLQERYHGWWAPYVQRLVDARDMNR